MLRRHFINVSYSEDIKPNEIWYRTSNGMMYDMQAVADLDTSSTHSFTLLSNAQRGGNWWCITFLEPVTHIGADQVTKYLYPLFCGVYDMFGMVDSNALQVTDVKLSNSVTSIGNSAFSSCSSLSSITIPEGVTSIEDGAFIGCSSLSSVVWNAKNCFDSKSESSSPFQSINSQITSFTFGNEVEHIPAYLCYHMGNLTSSITIPDSVTSIGKYAFYYCSSLSSITIPDSVTSIGDYAFHECSSLTSVTIPNSVISIGNSSFFGCSSLESIIIPNSVTSIADGAFGNCSSLTSVTIGNSVTSIGDRAFWGCSFTSIIIPNSVTSIGEAAFQNCSSLTSIVIPNSVTSIGPEAFIGCFSLSSIVIPDGVTIIGYNTFEDCSSLNSIIFEGTIKQWNAVTKGAYWNKNVPATVVHCTDGDVEI